MVYRELLTSCNGSQPKTDERNIRLEGAPMGFWGRLFGRERTNIRLAPERDWAVPVVGESHYQDVLQTLHQENGGEDDDALVIAELVPEDDNAFDPNAVRIDIGSTPLGTCRRKWPYNIAMQSVEPSADVARNSSAVSSCTTTRRHLLA
jgi:hypothetical protein